MYACIYVCMYVEGLDIEWLNASDCKRIFHRKYPCCACMYATSSVCMSKVTVFKVIITISFLSKVLITTDALAHRFAAPVCTVFNFDLPVKRTGNKIVADSETYLHRITCCGNITFRNCFFIIVVVIVVEVVAVVVVFVVVVVVVVEVVEVL